MTEDRAPYFQGVTLKRIEGSISSSVDQWGIDLPERGGSVSVHLHDPPYSERRQPRYRATWSVDVFYGNLREWAVGLTKQEALKRLETLLTNRGIR